MKRYRIDVVSKKHPPGFASFTCHGHTATKQQVIRAMEKANEKCTCDEECLACRFFHNETELTLRGILTGSGPMETTKSDTDYEILVKKTKVVLADSQ